MKRTPHRDLMARRREVVATLRLRQMTARAIAEAVSRMQEPSGGLLFGPVSEDTIERDIAWNTEQWKAKALEDTTALKGAQLSEIREARRVAWQERNAGEVRALMAMEIDLTGTKAPAKIAPTNPDGTEPYESLSDAERAARVRALIEIAGVGGDGPAAADLAGRAEATD